MIVLVAAGVALLAIFLVMGYLIDFKFEFKRPELSALHGRRNFIKGHSPFEYGTGDRAILALHGIAGSAAQVRDMSKRLASEGYHVYGATLPGHGTDAEDLYGITWQRWYRHAEAEFDRIRERHGKVSVLGFSLGAALGLKLALNRPVEKLVCISSPLYYFNSYIPLTPILSFAGIFATSGRAYPQRMPETEDGPEYLIYDRIPFDCLWALVDLTNELKPRLGEIRTPALICHSRGDPAAKPRGAQHIFDNLGSEEKRLVWFEEAPHGMMHGSQEDKDVLHSEITGFLG